MHWLTYLYYGFTRIGEKQVTFSRSVFNHCFFFFGVPLQQSKIETSKMAVNVFATRYSVLFFFSTASRAVFLFYCLSSSFSFL